jgi:hypothetical protein
VSVPDAPAACKEAVGSINSNGYGIITYDCTFATAAASNVTLNFTTTGLIAGGRGIGRRLRACCAGDMPGQDCSGQRGRPLLCKESSWPGE